MRLKQQEEPGFFILTEDCKIYAGLRKGLPYFSDNFDEARRIYNDEQFNLIQRGTTVKLSKEY